MTELCESPFMSDGKDHVRIREKLAKLEQSDKLQREQVAHLQDTARSQHSDLQLLKQERQHLREQNAQFQEENARLRKAAEASARGTTLLRDKVALYSGGIEGVSGGIPVDELEKALAMVRRKLDNPSALPFQLDDGASDALFDDESSVPQLKRKVQDLRLQLLTAQREAERAEHIVRTQKSISADLNAEVRLHRAKHTFSSLHAFSLYN